MGWDDVLKIISASLASVGGAGTIIWALSSWLGKVWASRILEADRAKYQAQLEVIKRYSESQFHLYNELWSSLCDLKIAGDALWENANFQNLRKFANQLQKTKQQVMRSSLLIEEDHYALLKNLLDEFSEFRLGKTRLIELRQASRKRPPIEEIRSAIEQNRDAKRRYSELMGLIEESLRQQISGK